MLLTQGNYPMHVLYDHNVGYYVIGNALLPISKHTQYIKERRTNKHATGIIYYITQFSASLEQFVYEAVI